MEKLLFTLDLKKHVEDDSYTVLHVAAWEKPGKNNRVNIRYEMSAEMDFRSGELKSISKKRSYAEVLTRILNKEVNR